MSENGPAIEFEFDDAQNQVLHDLAGKMKFVGSLLMLLGVLLSLVGIATAFSNVAEGVGNLVSGVVYLLLGYWTRQASSSFREIVDTEGRDITNLMNAMGTLRRLYSFQYWLCVIAVGLVVIGLLAFVLAAMLGG